MFNDTFYELYVDGDGKLLTSEAAYAHLVSPKVPEWSCALHDGLDPLLADGRLRRATVADVEKLGGIRFTKQDVFDDLTDNESFEDGMYWLHMYEDQEFSLTCSGKYGDSREVFTFTSDYRPDDDRDLDEMDIQEIYDLETEDSKAFMDCVEDLYEQAVYHFVDAE